MPLGDGTNHPRHSWSQYPLRQLQGSDEGRPANRVPEPEHQKSLVWGQRNGKEGALCDPKLGTALEGGRDARGRHRTSDFRCCSVNDRSSGHDATVEQSVYRGGSVPLLDAAGQWDEEVLRTCHAATARMVGDATTAPTTRALVGEVAMCTEPPKAHKQDLRGVGEPREADDEQGGEGSIGSSTEQETDDDWMANG